MNKKHITVRAWDPTNKRLATMNIYHDQLYQVIYTSGDYKFGWINTDMKLIKKLHKQAKIKSIDVELLPMDYIWNPDTKKIEKDFSILDLINDIKYIIPVKLLPAVNKKIYDRKQITFRNKTFCIYPNYPITIKMTNKKLIIGQVEATTSKLIEDEDSKICPLLKKKNLKQEIITLLIRPIVDSHPNEKLISINTDEIESIDHMNLFIK